jgi:glutamate dehydrogenase
MGITFVSRLMDETGANYQDIIKSFLIVREIFEANKLRNDILLSTSKLDSELVFSLLHDLNRLIRRATRWFLRNRRISNCSVKDTINEFKSKVKQIRSNLKSCLNGYALEQYEKTFNELLKKNAPVNLAEMAASIAPMFASLDIVEASFQTDQPMDKVATTYFMIGDTLNLGWLREQIKLRLVSNYWEALARGAFRDDIDNQQKRITVTILDSANDTGLTNINNTVNSWLEANKPQIDRWNFFIEQIKNQTETEFTMFSVALRELVVLANDKLSK